MLQKQNGIHPIDAYAGDKLREARKLRGLSQAALGQDLPEKVTFQQIQKYERGSNRIAISRMYEFLVLLRLPIDYFLPGSTHPSLPLLTTKETNLLNGFRRLTPEMQDKLSALVSTVVGGS